MRPEPFEESRRLTGCNVYFAGTGAALETAHGLSFDESTVERWQANVREARAALGWPQGEIAVRAHASGASLAFAAPMDQLYAATEVNEWAWYDALGLRAASTGDVDEAGEPVQPHVAAFARDVALRMLRDRAVAEANPALLALQQAADAHGVPLLADDDVVSIGAGAHGQEWAVNALPSPDQVPWATLRAIPTALVTGSNGKTTTVRLLGALCRAHGWPAAHSCTDGVFFDGASLETGDFSGPQGARTALRQPKAEAAILETARGGMLRRGLALCRADAAIVTNISVDHFGEYGVHDLDDLATVKLTVARAVADGGLLVLNADDAVLQRHAPRFVGQRLGWFSLDDGHATLVAHRDAGGDTCGVRDGRLLLHVAGATHDLGAIAAMPLSLGGQAAYNVANLAGAALVASALGIPPPTIAGVLGSFGASRSDNPGRLQRWQVGGVEVVIDYAHNPDGLHGLLRAVGADRREGRLAIVVGHAGNREEADLRAVAATAAAYAPELVLLKDVEGYLRGRASGEVARIMHDELLRRGVPAAAALVSLDEMTATRHALAWVRQGDLLVLPTFDRDARERIEAMLATMADAGWQPGDALPPAPMTEPVPESP
ncbi:Mur ligase [Luteimonas aestuarii]|uniref:Mur ligase n=1 Tax=Luteimonas aestuarii TaxID=453837 RepID=A0A4R5TPD0_9GAMM|nr:Mur ligase family protein [Luteimonas aestuarii]TDK24304.1 Mur ligase [Luteimonas aestuarii]